MSVTMRRGLSLLRYQSSWLRSDVVAGLSVAAVALPVGIARVKRNLGRFFDPEWLCEHAGQTVTYRFAAVKSVVRAFNKGAAKAASPEDAATRTAATADRKNDNPSSVP